MIDKEQENKCSLEVAEMRKEDICAVVVTYNPDGEMDDRIGKLASQVKRIVIIDNGSRSESFAGVVKATTRGEHT